MDKTQTCKGSAFKFSQIFGYKGPNEKVLDQDVISTLKFDQTGRYLSLGDRAGRVIVFEALEGKKKEPDYEYLTEFQSHSREFDPLRSMDV